MGLGKLMQIKAEQTIKKSNPLGWERIGKLLFKFSLPGIISMLVNSLYNIVDQIFIGQGVGYLGNGATTVIFPLTTIALAFSLLIGDGCASYMSLMLGRREEEKASKGVAVAVWGAILIGTLLAGLFILLLEPLCLLFGATPLILPYAKEYGLIIALGMPFASVSVAYAGFIRADGSPIYNMVGLISGCVANIVLDYLFIMHFNWGVKGAALATIIGQAINAVIYIVYLFKLKTVKLNKKIIAQSFNLKYFLRVAKMGASSFINQALIVIIIGAQNNLLKTYGAQSVYGPEIPMTALGVTMKLFNIIMAVLIGLSGGSQPIWGYNYGSGRKDRVRKTFFYSCLVGTIVMVIAFAVFQLFPEQVVSIFGHEDALYTEFSVKCLKIYLFALPLFAVRMMVSSLLQSVGKPFWAAFLSLSKQIMLQLPAMFILSSIMGVDGVLWSGPLSDVLSFILSIIVLLSVGKKVFKVEEKSDFDNEINKEL